ncbi:hypothetical protein BVC71_12260 [Marivivens niveibacter]|uniref:Uncharacterized protein n=1 Tax=Marivivens niveibacter TaxID=1930667 RepID=A0A251WX48_9RHOB|nr:hypothetical protein BVC71_12260 [Marivivens niveibacter]
MTAGGKSICTDCGALSQGQEICDKCVVNAQIAPFPPFASVLIIALMPVVIVVPVIFWILRV